MVPNVRLLLSFVPDDVADTLAHLVDSSVDRGTPFETAIGVGRVNSRFLPSTSTRQLKPLLSIF